MSDLGKTVTKSRMRLIFVANCIGVSSLLATVLSSTTRNTRIVGYAEAIAKCGQRGLIQSTEVRIAHVQDLGSSG
jgi:hypothetical protein